MHYQFSRFKIIKDYYFLEADRWILWWPVGMGIGIAGYFSLLIEPMESLGGGLFGVLCFLVWKCPWGRGLWVSLLAVVFGFTCCQWRTARVNTMMLEKSIHDVSLKGVIHCVDYRHGYWRYVIDHVEGEGLELPAKIRVNHRKGEGQILPHMKIHLDVDLYPLPLPVSPQGFDFRRQSYFQGIGATGRVKKIISITPAPDWLGIDTLRHHINTYFLSHLSPLPAALSMAFITGERGMIPDEVRQQFTDAGLAHLLAISGLHLGLVVGILFFLIRHSLMVVPWLGERWSLKKIAAFLSIPLAAGYLALSGAGIPAQRAFLMIAIVMLAILCDRQAISMRLVALAATVILTLTPESLLHASFQLSFAAVLGLVAVYEVGGKRLFSRYSQGGFFNKLKMNLLGVMVTSSVASCATLPLTIYIFNRFTLVAIIGNMLAVPLMGMAIIPLLLLLVALGPFLDVPWIIQGVEISLTSLITLAEHCSQLPGAVIEVSTPHPGFLITTILGGLWFCLWQQKWRYGGIGGWIMAPFFLNTHHPILYVTLDGMAMVSPQTKTLNIMAGKSSAFLLHQWHRDWIHYRVQEVSQPLMSVDEISLVLGKISGKEKRRLCKESFLIVTSSYLRCGGGSGHQPLIVDRKVLFKEGALFVWPNYHVQGVKEILGKRPWVTKAS